MYLVVSQWQKNSESETSLKGFLHYMYACILCDRSCGPGETKIYLNSSSVNTGNHLCPFGVRIKEECINIKIQRKKPSVRKTTPKNNVTARITLFYTMGRVERAFSLV